LPDAPEPLLLERRVETGDDAYVDRITADGIVWTGGTVAATLENGDWSFERSEPSWRRQAMLPPGPLEALRKAIAGSGFFATPAEHHPDTPVIHASREVWTAELDGRRHTSTLYARGVTTAEPLSTLAVALESALAAIDVG
jgi:hypothetical protein